MKKTKGPGISDAQKRFFREARLDPIRFAERILGATLWDRQKELLLAIRDHRRTAIKACHGVGKTYALACAVLWWLARYPDGIVLTTSSTQRQVRTQLWSEIHRLVAQARFDYPEIHTTELKLRGEENFALGLSTNRAENFSGYHGKHLLVIADEANGIAEEVWDAVAGVMAGGHVRLVMAGNPTIPSGPFFDAFQKDGALWHPISIDAFDSPNLAGLSLGELLRMDPADDGPLDENPTPYLVTRRWVYEQHQVWWHGDERSSPVWMARVRGEFPDQAENALIKLRWLERAQERAARNPVVDHGGPLVAGIDVGGVDSETVIYICASTPHHNEIIKMAAWRGEDTRGEAVRFLNSFRGRFSTVRVDSVGVGYNFAMHLRDEGFPVAFINVGEVCAAQPELGENDPARRFANQKAQLYQNLANAFEADEVDGLSDRQTIAQLSDLLYEVDSRGRLKIESKEKARKRRLASPDRAEALMLAIGHKRERIVPDYMLSENAANAYRRGDRVEAIAVELDATVDEVRQWIEEQRLLEFSRFPFLYDKVCAFCAKPIKLEEEWHFEFGCYYHKACYTKKMYGPHAG